MSNDILNRDEICFWSKKPTLWQCVKTAFLLRKVYSALTSTSSLEEDLESLVATEQEIASQHRYKILYSFRPDNLENHSGSSHSAFSGLGTPKQKNSPGLYKAAVYRLGTFADKKSTYYIWSKQCTCESDMSRADARYLAMSQITLLEDVDANHVEYVNQDVAKLHGAYLPSN